MRLYYLGLHVRLAIGLCIIPRFIFTKPDRISRLFRILSFNPWGASLMLEAQGDYFEALLLLFWT